MHRPKVLLVVAVLAFLVGAASPASADITAFLGFTPTTSNRLARGLALGGGALFFGFELEYSNISEDAGSLAPGLKTGMANVLIQTLPISGFRLYGTIGGGFYWESLGGVSRENFASNFGGGVKFHLVGPLGGRVDYRLFKLSGSPVVDTYHRIYGGVNLSF